MSRFNFVLFFSILTLLLPPAVNAQDHGFRVLAQKPIPREFFTQGLEFEGDDLLISSGLYEVSKLVRLDFKTLEPIGQLDNDPDIFAEGVTVLGERIYQLTWKKELMLVHDRSSLKQVASWAISGQGWGLTNNGSELIYSNGSHQLTFVNPEDGKVTRTLNVTLGGGPVSRLNELEWIDGNIWANIWGADLIAIIDPESGLVTNRVNLKGLLPRSDRRRDTDVLNGIARHPETGAIWVTGKRWPWLYQIEVVGYKPAKIASPIPPAE